MWHLYWEENTISVADKQKVFDIIQQLNHEYEERKPIFVQVENPNGDRMCIGIGNFEGYSFIDFFSAGNGSSKHIKGENFGEDTICFFVGDCESEFYISETVNYKTALKVLKVFLWDNKLAEFVEWIDD